MFWAGKDNSHLIATLFSDFSESKKSRSKECKPKDFRRSNAAAKARLRGGFHSKECKRLPQQTAPPKAQKPLFCTVHETVTRNRSQMLRTARWGWFLSNGSVDIIPIFAMSRLFYYSLAQNFTFILLNKKLTFVKVISRKRAGRKS